MKDGNMWITRSLVRIQPRQQIQVLTKNEISMRKSWSRFIQKQKEEWREFAEIIGLKNSIQQLAVGAALCILLLAACGAGEWLSHQF